ncbi:hypothetical protein BSLG_003819 [Batrachochytrium salamandrivorans]|nr:hypothetical protein BSLG_003819 [Batrachochytrium salamandrivorans]
MQRMALLLYDYLLEEHSKEDSEMQSLDQMVSSLSMPYPTLESDTDDKMKFIVKVMDILDFNDSLRPWILDHPIEPGEDIEDSLPTHWPPIVLGFQDLFIFESWPMLRLPLESLCPSAFIPSSPLQTRGFHEIAVAESLGGFDIDSAAGDADMAALKTNTTTSLDERPLPRKASINLNAHFDAQILLADASMKAKLRDCRARIHSCNTVVCLQLAGGVEHASSPPVAILATPNAQKTMPIRLFWMSPSNLEVATQCDFGYLIPNQSAQYLSESLTESATPFRLTLSSNRRMTIAGDHFLPIKAVCAHCCMTFTSDDPIKCSECATQRIYVYYCTEECATENKSTHDQDCIKGNTLGNSSEFSLTGMTAPSIPTSQAQLISQSSRSSIDSIKTEAQGLKTSIKEARSSILALTGSINTTNDTTLSYLSETMALLGRLEAAKSELQSLPSSASIGPSKSYVELIELLMSPIRKSFKFHFYGKRPTNSLKKPEYYLKFILKILVDQQDFLDDFIQPFLNQISSINLSAKEIFSRSLADLVSRKLQHDLPNLLLQPASFLHTIEEVFLFDENMRENYISPELFSTTWKSCAEIVLENESVFALWADLERQATEVRFKEIVSDPDRWTMALVKMSDIDDDHTLVFQSACKVCLTPFLTGELWRHQSTFIPINDPRYNLPYKGTRISHMACCLGSIHSIATSIRLWSKELLLYGDPSVDDTDIFSATLVSYDELVAKIAHVSIEDIMLDISESLWEYERRLIDERIWEKLVVRGQFSFRGGSQFSLDEARFLHSLQPMHPSPAALLPRLSEASTILALPVEATETDQVDIYSIMLAAIEDGEEPMPMLERIGVFQLTSKEVREVVGRRIEALGEF